MVDKQFCIEDLGEHDLMKVGEDTCGDVWWCYCPYLEC